MCTCMRMAGLGAEAEGYLMTPAVHSPGAGLGGGGSTSLKPPDLDCRPSAAIS